MKQKAKVRPIPRNKLRKLHKMRVRNRYSLSSRMRTSGLGARSKRPLPEVSPASFCRLDVVVIVVPRSTSCSFAATNATSPVLSSRVVCPLITFVLTGKECGRKNGGSSSKNCYRSMAARCVFFFLQILYFCT